jgi:hypothetical protein
LLSSRLEDVSWVDAFGLPSIFDPRLPLYKEWHDFVFFDRNSQLFGLLNFAVHGNPYDSKRGYGAALAFLVGPGGKIHTALKLIPLSKLTVSVYSPDFVGEEVAVSYLGNNSFSIKGRIDDISLDLSIPVILPPVTMNQIGFDILTRNKINLGMLGAAAEMTSIWDKWVELPRLSVVGRIGVHGTDHSVNTTTGYQDHEGGRFDWGSVLGWDTGVLLCDPTSGGEPEKVSFLFYRYGRSGESSYGGIIVKTADGNERFFGAEKITITRSGEFSGERAYMPGVTKLLYPDYQPKVPATIVFSATDSSDSVDIAFTPRAVCTIVVPSVSDKAETTFNEMYCDASFEASIGSETYKKLIPCWFESVRPRGRLNDHAP